MVLFDTISFAAIKETAIFVCFQKRIMTNVKYSLCPSGCSAAVGTTDLKKSGGNLIDTNGCIVLLIVSGYAVATVNCRKRALRRGDVLVLFYDDIFIMSDISKNFAARFVSLAYEHVEDAIYKIPSPAFWDALYEHPVYHAPEDEWQLFTGWWRQLEWIDRKGNEAYRDELLKSCFYTFLLAIEGVVVKYPATVLHSSTNRGWKVIMDFYKLLSKYGKEKRDVQFYASELCITTTYLYKICRKVLRSSPKDEIDKQAISEIKTCLANTDLSIKRIAEELHFEDVSYLCRYFKRLTGLSPADYRDNRSTL